MTPLDNLVKRHGIAITAQLSPGPVPDTMPEGSRAWKITLKFGKESLSTEYYTGPAIEREPSAADVLYCLLADAGVADLASFEDFCAEFGYDTDSRRAERIYESCKRMAPKLAKFLGRSYADFVGAEH